MRTALIAVLFFFCVAPAGGQTIWSRPYQPNQIALEAVVPDAADDATVLSGASFLTWTVSLNENVELATELPFARYGSDVSGVSSTTAVGNPLVGLGFSGTRFPFFFQFGARIPTSPSNAAASLGQNADIGRVPAFESDGLSFTGLLNGRAEIGRFSTARFRAGIGYAPHAESDESRDWRSHYEAQLWREGERLITGLTFSGQALLTKPGTTQHHAALSLMGNWNRVQPGLLVGTSLNNLVENGNFAPFAGLTLSVSYLRR